MTMVLDSPGGARAFGAIALTCEVVACRGAGAAESPDLVRRWIAMPRRSAWLALAALLLGLACLVYAGPGRAVVRGHVGDVAAAMFVYAAFGLTGWSRRSRVAAALIVTALVELGQTVWSPIGRSGVGALLIGGVCDPWDLVAYVAGVAVGVAWEATG